MELPIPIQILKKGDKLPKETCYLITSDGIFLYKITGVVEAMVKVEGICFLDSVKTSAVLHMPRLNSETMAMAVKFFHGIHVSLDCEANLLIHYSPDSRDTPFVLSCPEQTVTSASVKYKSDERIEGYGLIGTIHSHNHMNAFHSGVDKDDEFHFDGLHIVVGRLDNFPEFSISCFIVVNGERFKLEPEDTIIGIRREKKNSVYGAGKSDGKNEGRIMRAVARAVDEYVVNPLCNALYGSYIAPYAYGGYYAGYEYGIMYEIVMPRCLSYDDVNFPEDWFSRVRPLSFVKKCEPSEIPNKPLLSPDVGEDILWEGMDHGS